MDSQASREESSISFSWGVKIPMRDGVHLNATLYRPKDEAPVPAVVTITPYTADSYHERAFYFSQNGYAFALVDTRGRGNSEGEFDGNGPDDGRDGYDVVEWLAAQPWCNGKVGMWGGSYAGYNQWATLRHFPPHLSTIVPAAAALPGVDFPHFNNMAFSYEIQWATLTSGVTANMNLFSEQKFWIQHFRDMYLHHRAFAELGQIVGNESPYFKRCLQHPTVDEYTESLSPLEDEYRRMDIPILTITGQYDGDQPGALAYYRRHMQSASDEAREKHFLIIGPWDHPGTRTPKREVGGLTFGEASVVDLNGLHKAWYDWTMKDAEKPEFLKDRVAYYVTRAEEWKYIHSLNDLAVPRPLYLDSSGGRANDVFHSGRLEESPSTDSPPDSYVYDPLDTRPAEIEREEVKTPLTDQRYALNLFGNGVIYHSAPFEVDTQISGDFRFSVWIKMDVPDTDLRVQIWEILSDGGSVFLTEDAQRARYRHSLKEAHLVTPGEIIEYVFDSFTFTARRVSKGSRLRLLLSCPNSIYWQKNYNSGGDVALETAQDARTAHLTVYHDAERPSCLEIPVVAESANSG